MAGMSFRTIGAGQYFVQGQYSNLEENLQRVKGSHDQVLHEMELLNKQLKHKEKEVLTLQNELKQGTTSQRAMLEVREMCHLNIVILLYLICMEAHKLCQSFSSSKRG